jgi:hypothetical protein
MRALVYSAPVTFLYHVAGLGRRRFIHFSLPPSPPPATPTRGFIYARRFDSERAPESPGRGGRRAPFWIYASERRAILRRKPPIFQRSRKRSVP